MKRLSTIVLGISLFASSAIYASSDHSGDHMHKGKMQNHANTNNMTDSKMKSMDHGKMAMNMKHGKMSSKKAYKNMMMVDGYKVILSSKKPLSDGKNMMSIILEKNTKVVKDAAVSIKFAMLSMPGMEFTKKASLHGKKYDAMINFSMIGQWDYDLSFKSNDGQMHTAKGSVNLK